MTALNMAQASQQSRTWRSGGCSRKATTISRSRGRSRRSTSARSATCSTPSAERPRSTPARASARPIRCRAEIAVAGRRRSRQRDEQRVRDAGRRGNVPTAPVKTGADGGMHRALPRQAAAAGPARRRTAATSRSPRPRSTLPAMPATTSIRRRPSSPGERRRPPTSVAPPPRARAGRRRAPPSRRCRLVGRSNARQPSLRLGQHRASGSRNSRPPSRRAAATRRPPAAAEAAAAAPSRQAAEDRPPPRRAAGAIRPAQPAELPPGRRGSTSPRRRQPAHSRRPPAPRRHPRRAQPTGCRDAGTGSTGAAPVVSVATPSTGRWRRTCAARSCTQSRSLKRQTRRAMGRAFLLSARMKPGPPRLARSGRGSACISCRSRRGRPRCGRPCPRSPGRSGRAARRGGAGAVAGAAPAPAPPSRQRQLVLAGRRIDVVRLHVAAVSAAPARRRRCTSSTRISCAVTASRRLCEHRLEQLEGFRLVLVQRIALAVAAQADDLAQMVEHDEMLAPQMVERLQQDRLLDIAHARRGPTARPWRPCARRRGARCARASPRRRCLLPWPSRRPAGRGRARG